MTHGMGSFGYKGSNTAYTGPVTDKSWIANMPTGIVSLWVDGSQVIAPPTTNTYTAFTAVTLMRNNTNVTGNTASVVDVEGGVNNNLTAWMQRSRDTTDTVLNPWAPAINFGPTLFEYNGSGSLWALSGIGWNVMTSRFDSLGNYNTFLNGVKMFIGPDWSLGAAPTLVPVSTTLTAANLTSPGFPGSVGYDIKTAAFYGRSLSDAEVVQASDVLRRWQLSSNVGSSFKRVVVFDGDSLPFAANSSCRLWYADNTSSAYGIMQSIGGSRLNTNVVDVVPRRATAIDALIPSNKRGFKYTYYLSIGHNDIAENGGTDATVYVNSYISTLLTHLSAVRAAGFDKIIITTVFPRSDDVHYANHNVNRKIYNNIITTPNWAQCNGIDAIADLASDPIMGVDGVSDNTTYFKADKVHPSYLGWSLLKPYTAWALNYTAT